MTDLSPATQAVLDASNLLAGKDSYLILAAALRAAADQVEIPAPSNDWLEGFVEGVLAFQRGLLDIAAELRGTTNTSGKD
jgi:hypothetical protein